MLQGQPLHPLKHALQIFTDVSKEGWGGSLKRAYSKGILVPSRKQAAYKLPRTESSLSGPEGVLRPLLRQDCSCSNRKHHSGVIHKQGRRHEVRVTVCPSVENTDLVFQKTGDSQSLTYSRPAECGSRQAIQARPDHPDRVVWTPWRYWTPWPGQWMHSMGGSGCICLPTSSHLGQSGGEGTGLPMQENHSDCSRVTQHALVLGPSGHIESDPTVPTQPAESVNSALQSDSSHESDKPKPTCVAPRT